MEYHLPPDAAQLSAEVTSHCVDKGYFVDGPSTERHGYLNFEVSIPDRGSGVRISLNGEVFTLSFPGGYSWTEFAQYPEDTPDVLADVLAFLDAYADPATGEVEVMRRLRRPRLELHVQRCGVASARVEQGSS